MKEKLGPRGGPAVAGAAVTASLLLAEPALAAGGGLEIIPSLGKLMPLLVAFVVLVPLLNGLLFRPLFRVLDERDQRIEGARTRAARIAADADALIARHGSAIHSAREEADQRRKEELERARREQADRIGAERAEAERTLDAARRGVASALESARQSLRQDVGEIARQAASRILGRPLA